MILLTSLHVSKQGMSLYKKGMLDKMSNLKRRISDDFLSYVPSDMTTMKFVLLSCVFMGLGISIYEYYKI